jgi:hypothetical protein
VVAFFFDHWCRDRHGRGFFQMTMKAAARKKKA